MTRRDLGKTAAEKRTTSPGPRFEWSGVLRALRGEEARSSATGLYRAAGFKPHDFERPAARRAMADALSRTEDFLEMRRATREREAIRDVRRALESESEAA